MVKALGDSDAVLAFQSGTPNAWSEWEVLTAQSQGIPVVSMDLDSVVSGGKSYDKDKAEVELRRLISQLLPSGLSKP